MKIIKRTMTLAFVLTSIFLNAQNYFPLRGESWPSISPEAVGFNADSLTSCVKFAMDNEYSGSKDLRIAILEGFRREPFHEILGPTKKRGGPAGMIIKNGKMIAEWGDLEKVEMTFSVTKSYLSTVAGLAIDEGWVRSEEDHMMDYVWDGTFDGNHNRKITWRNLLEQNSDWSGTLFGGKDWADRPPREGELDEWKYRTFQEPGTFFEYNDVRVNVLAYSLLQVWRKPLPMILREKIMDPIGASSTWRWNGYKDAFTNVDGVMMQSVSGGGHSGGGMFVSTMDQARFGYLFLNNGNWNGDQLISKEWVKKVQRPSGANESYGFMWWLNRGNRAMEGVPQQVFYAAGFGGNYIYIDQVNNLMIVTRWLEPKKSGEFLKKVYNSIKN